MNRKENSFWNDFFFENFSFEKEMKGEGFVENFKQELQKLKRELNLAEKPKLLRLENVFSPEEDDPYEFLDVVFFLQEFYEKTQELKGILSMIKKKTEKSLESDEETEVNYYGSYENLLEKAEMLSNEIDEMKKSEYLNHPFVQTYFSDKVSINELKHFIKLSKNFDVGAVKVDDKIIPVHGIKSLISKILQREKSGNGKVLYYAVKNTLAPFQYLLLLILREIGFNEEEHPVNIVEELFESFLSFLLRCYKILEHTDSRAGIMIFLMRLFFANEMNQPEEILEAKQKRLAWVRYKRKQLTDRPQGEKRENKDGEDFSGSK